MRDIRHRLQEQGLTCELKESARAWLARQGYDPNFGARPLRRALQKYIEGPLSMELLKGTFKAGDNVIIDLNPDDKGLVFSKSVDAETDDKPAEQVVVDEKKENVEI